LHDRGDVALAAQNKVDHGHSGKEVQVFHACE
jgi:hypothetical protein